MTGLTPHNLKHFTYLNGLATQPASDWTGFYRTPADGMNFGLRFQLAFSAYALYGLARLTPAYPAPYQTALNALIEKMLLPDVWAYWFRGAVRNLSANQNETSQPRNSLQSAVEIAHTRLGLNNQNISPDPCREGNVQYSGHLASMLGFYQLLSADDQYSSKGFTLQAEAFGQNYSYDYTYHTLAARIHAQMSENYFHGLCCEPGRAYAACNNHACISNLLYDQLYGTEFSKANLDWADWVRTRMLRGEGFLPLPAPNGLLSVAYMPGLHLPIPLSFNLTDAWGLAFMTAWEPELAQREYNRFRKKLHQVSQPTGKKALQLGSLGPNENMEISNTGLNTGFAYLLAREMGDLETAQRLRWYADEFLSPVEADGKLYYAQGKPIPYVTALFALGDALPETGGGLFSLMRWRPIFSEPYLLEVITSGAQAAVIKAEYSQSNGLQLGLQSEPDNLIELRIANCTNEPHIRVWFGPVDKSAATIISRYNENESSQTSCFYFEPSTAQLTVKIKLLSNTAFLNIQ